MPNIERSDGTIVSWGGSVLGPKQVLNEMGGSTGWTEFKTECAVDGEIHEVTFVIRDSELLLFGAATPEREERIRQCVAQHFENQLKDSRRRIPERKEQFTLTASDLKECQPRAAENAKKWLVTVQLPVWGGSPEFHDLEVADPGNAVTMLNQRLRANPRYNWDTAQVVRKRMKE
jgi:hypothetical protein